MGSANYGRLSHRLRSDHGRGGTALESDGGKEDQVARVLVLGASGYVGSHLIPRLLAGDTRFGPADAGQGLWKPAVGTASRRFTPTLSIQSR